VHNVLGLSVTVTAVDGTKTNFGDGQSRIIIEWIDPSRSNTPLGPGVVLFTSAESDEVQFELSQEPYEQDMLVPSCRHAILGFGTHVFLSDDVRRPDLQSEMAQFIIATCMSARRECVRHWAAQQQLPERQWIVASEEHIYAIGSTLFDGIPITREAIWAMADQQDL